MRILGIKSIECDLLEMDLNFDTLTRRSPLSPIENNLDFEAARPILEEMESRYWLNQDEAVYRDELLNLMIDYRGRHHGMG